jgi:hypothetical protein
VAFLNESLEIISSAPLIGHGTGSIAEEFRQVTSAKNGAAGVATVNPHNQTFAVAIQIGLIGAIVLWSMWIAHIRLFHSEGIVAWLGTVVVVENIVSSTVHSHLFDFANGWLYVFGVGVLGGMILGQQSNMGSGAANVRKTRHPMRPLNGCPELHSDSSDPATPIISAKIALSLDDGNSAITQNCMHNTVLSSFSCLLAELMLLVSVVSPPVQHLWPHRYGACSRSSSIRSSDPRTSI